jgi:hypothetical protein
VDVSLQVVGEDGSITPPWYLADHDGETTSAIATSLDETLTFVASGRAFECYELTALRFVDGGPEHLWRVGIPRDAVVLQDPASRVVALLTTTRPELRLTRLGPQRPALPDGDTDTPALLPNMEGHGLCAGPVGEAKERIRELHSRLGELSRTRREDWTDRYVDEHAEDPDALWALADALPVHGLRERADGIVEQARHRYPDHTGLRLLAVDRDGGERDWALVRELLDGCDTSTVDDGTAQHVHHLLGLAWLKAGDVERARAAFVAGIGFKEGTCDLFALLELVTPLPDPLEPSNWDESHSDLRQLHGAIQTADACLARGDPAGAIEVMDRDAVWSRRELCSTARLAEAYLGRMPTRSVEVLKMSVALSTFLDRLGTGDEPRGQSLDLPDHVLSRETLADLARRCEAWLDGHPPGERPEPGEV